jgi:hypothetical protein
LKEGDPIYVKISADNVIGTSDYSDAGTGATVFTPIVPGAPVNITENLPVTTKT